MKGRWFFWIPVILYGLYILFPFLIVNKETVYLVLKVGFGVHILISIICLFINYSQPKDKRIELEDMKDDKSLYFILYFYPAIIIVLNYYLDKYLTIKKK